MKCVKVGPLVVGVIRRPIRLYFCFRLAGFRMSNYPRWDKDSLHTYMVTRGRQNEFPVDDSCPFLEDRGVSAGNVGSDYFLQDIYMAQQIFRNNPNKHVDIGSRVDGFVAHVATFREIELFDIRPICNNIKNISFKQADIMDETSIPSNYCDSISSLHVIEHIGLGRYGDRIDPEGHIVAFQNIAKILKPGGLFYFSVPMGRQRVEFNGQRVFGIRYLLRWVSLDFEIKSFAYIDDANILHTDSDYHSEAAKDSFGCETGCALFVLRKK